MRLSLLWTALAVVVFVLAGCAGNRPLSDPASSSLSDVNDALTNETARLYLNGAQSGQNASLVTLTRDSLYYVDGILSRNPAPQRDRPMRQVHISAVDSVGVKYNGGGGRAGALIGAIPGLATGTELGISVFRNCGASGTFNSCSLGAFLTGLYMVAVAGGGALLGALIGNAVDDDVQTVYRAPVSRSLTPAADSSAIGAAGR